jgi:flagellin-like protein
MSDTRAVSSVISVIIMVAIVVVLAATVSVFVLEQDDWSTEPSPNAVFDRELLDEGKDSERLEVTHTHGNRLRANQILIVATDPVDLGGSNADPTGSYATIGEKLTEGEDQTGIGKYWEPGESILIGGVGDLSDITIRIVWNTTEVDKDDQNGKAPSDLVGKNSFILWKYTLP